MKSPVFYGRAFLCQHPLLYHPAPVFFKLSVSFLEPEIVLPFVVACPFLVSDQTIFCLKAYHLNKNQE
jgi:hypothetical protein